MNSRAECKTRPILFFAFSCVASKLRYWAAIKNSFDGPQLSTALARDKQFLRNRQQFLQTAALDHCQSLKTKVLPVVAKLHSCRDRLAAFMPKTRTDKRMSVTLTEQSQGLWIDAEVMARIHGTGSKLSAPHITSDQERLLHYADICLGTAKPDEFKSEKPVHSRKKGTRKK